MTDLGEPPPPPPPILGKKEEMTEGKMAAMAPLVQGLDPPLRMTPGLREAHLERMLFLYNFYFIS